MKRLAFLAVALLLAASCYAQHSASLTATASVSPGVTGYNTYRSATSGGPYSLLGLTAAPAYTDTTVIGGMGYYYVMTAVASGGLESAFSNQVFGLVPSDPPPPPPTTVSLWTVDVPAHTAGNDSLSVELGTKFTTSVAGSAVGCRFYKATNSTAAHTCSLWNSSGLKLTTVAVTGETASGWQTATFPTPITLAVGTTYTISYHTVQYAYTQPYFTAAHVAPPLTAPINAGVYAYGSSSIFPTQVYSGSNYWADVVFNPAVVAPPPVTITIVPLTSTLIVGASQQFTAPVTNTANTAVTWSANAPNGLFTSTAVGSFSVTATSQADATKSATASVTVTPPPATLTLTCVGFTCTVGETNMSSGTVLPVTVTGPGTLRATSAVAVP